MLLHPTVQMGIRLQVIFAFQTGGHDQHLQVVIFITASGDIFRGEQNHFEFPLKAVLRADPVGQQEDFPEPLDGRQHGPGVVNDADFDQGFIR